MFEYSFRLIVEAKKKNTAESDALLASTSNFQDKQNYACMARAHFVSR